MFWFEDLVGAACSAIIGYFTRRLAEADAMVVDSFEQELEKAHCAELDEWDQQYNKLTGKALPWQAVWPSGRIGNYPGKIIRGDFSTFLSPGLAQAFDSVPYLGSAALQQHQCATHEEFAAQTLRAQMNGMAQQRQMTQLEQLQHQLGLQQQIGPGFDASYLQSLLGNAAKSPKSRPE